MRKSLVLSLVGALAPASAVAHFKLNAIDEKMPVSWMSQDAQGAPQKTGPCAAVGTGTSDPAGKPTNVVTDVKAGQMVSITVQGTIGHPGWYRVSLVEGPSSSQTLSTLPDPALQTKCTAAMISNPVWSSTQPVIGDGLPPGSTTATSHMGTETLKVMLPATANCTPTKPCTLQVVMIMTDHSPPDCFYHHCADITYSGGSGGAGGMGAGSGGPGGISQGGSTGAGGAVATGGLSASGGSIGSGGATNSGGSSSTGGSQSTGGSTSTGGKSSSGGSMGSGGATSSGGSSSTGGAQPTGGTTQSGGSNGSGGVGSGGSSATGASDNGGGCAVAPRAEPAFTLLAAVFLAALVKRRDGRRRR